MSIFRTEKRNTVIVVFLAVLLSVYPALLMNSAKQNMLLLGVMAISPIAIFLSQKILIKYDLPLIVMYVLMLSFPLVFYPTSVRWSTLIYTGMFICLFLAYIRILYSSELTVEQFKNLLKWLIYLYAITLLVQLTCFFLGLPIFNRINVDLTHGFPRLNALGPEPAWTARILSLFMLLYCCLSDYLKGYKVGLVEIVKEEKWVCISYVFVIIACGSTTGLIFACVLLCRFINIKSILYVAILLFAVFSLGSIMEINSFNRVTKFLPALFTLNEDMIIEADGSGASRIVPTIATLKQVSLTTLDGWIGHGVDADMGIYKIGSIKTNGGAFSLWYNYGFVVQIIYLTYIIWICWVRNEWSLIAIAILYIFGGVTLNLQLLWFLLAMCCTYKYVISNKIL